MKKVLLIVLAVVIALPLIAWAVIVLKGPPRRPPSTETIEATPERLARGKYLYNGLALCAHCHTPHDDKLTGYPIAGAVGRGWCMPEFLGLPGKICSSNITPDKKTGVGDYTDGELVRVIRENVRRGDKPMFPIHNFPEMSDEDTRAIVAYMKTVPAVENNPGETKLKFPQSVLVNLLIEPLEGPVTAPDKSDPVKYGRYLVKIGACRDCHDGEKDGKELKLGGGQSFDLGDHVEVSKNLTREATTGLGSWNEEMFAARFHAAGFGEPQPLQPGTVDIKVMPWRTFSSLSDEDLKFIWAYLQSVDPVVNPDDDPAPKAH